MIRTKKILFAAMCCGISFLLKAQNQVSTLSHGGVFEHVYDKEGNAYLLEDLITDPLKPSSLGGGQSTDCAIVSYFDVEYDPGSGFENSSDPIHIQRRTVLCHVLENISRLIIPVDPLNPVRIRMRAFSAMGYTQNQGDSILASASSFSAFPQPVANIGGILDNLIWKTINSGQDAYNDITGMVIPTSQNVSLFIYHGQCTVNFRDEDDSTTTFNSNPIHWNLNVGAAPQFIEFDLYSVLLHEMMHALGFDTNIQINGTSQIASNPYFTRYDSFLQKPIGNNQLFPLLADPSEPCSMYTSLWNSNIPTTVLNPNCTGLTEFDVDCTSAIQFGGTLNQGIYNPGCYAAGSSLAHMSDFCDEEPVTEFEHYLMAPGFPNSVMRRFPQPEERTILCNLGYHVADRFGYSDTLGTGTDDVFLNEFDYETESCGGDQVVGFHDGIDTTNTFTLVCYDGEPISFNGATLLGNDYFPIGGTPGFECLELILGSGTIAVNGNATLVSGNATSMITFDPGYVNGTFLLRYVPVQNGIKGNITYVFLQGASTPPEFIFPYYSFGECTLSACSLIPNGNFETDAQWCSHQCRSNQSHQDEITCWKPYGTPVIRSVYFTRNSNVLDSNNVSYVCSGSGNIYCRPMNHVPFAGINSNTRSNPPCDTHDTNPENNAFIFIGANRLQSPPLSADSVMSGRFRNELASPLIPGASYVLSYYAKVFYSNLEDSLSNFLIDELVADDLYHSGNVEARVRFLIDNRGGNIDFGYVPTSIAMLNTALHDSTLVLAELEPIPPVGPNPSSQSDWHYREGILQIPDTLGSDFQHLTIDYNIWDTPYANILTGVFIDDVSLRPYYGEIINLPDTICSSEIVQDMQSFVVTSAVQGEFSCPQFPAAVVYENGEYAFNPMGISAEEVYIVFTYTSGNGCEITETNVIHLIPCCTYVNDEIYHGACDEPELLNWISLFVADGDNSEGDTDSFTFEWTPAEDVILAQTTPIHSLVTGLQCGIYEVAITNTELNCTEVYEYDIVCFGPEPLEANVIAHEGVCYLSEIPWLESVVTGGTGFYSFDWMNQNSNQHYYSPNVYNAEPGVYILTVTDELGCTASVQAYITQEANDTYGQITFDTECFFIPGSPIQFFTTAEGEEYAYLWDFGNGATSDLQNPTVQFDAAQDYTVQLTIITPLCEVTLDPIVITIGDFDWPSDIIITSQADVDTYLIDGNTYGGDIVFQGNILHYVVEQITLYLGPNADIILEEDAFVTFDHCTFTSCGNWNGIDLRSYSETIENPAILVMTNCDISYANIAIRTADSTEATGNNEAGIYHISDCTFANNLLCVKVNEADHPTVEIGSNYVLGIFNSHFLINDEYKDHFEESFRFMVAYNRVRYYNFTSCDFENDVQEVEDWSDRGEAIHGLDANFYVDDVDTETLDAGLSWFKGFSTAIDVSIVNGAYNHMMVRETDFTQNRIAIFNRNVCFQRLVKNH